MNPEAKYCDSCGRSLLVTTSEGATLNVSALQISVTMEDFVVRQVLGPYTNKEYNFCYICILQLLGAEGNDEA